MLLFYNVQAVEPKRYPQLDASRYELDGSRGLTHSQYRYGSGEAGRKEHQANYGISTKQQMQAWVASPNPCIQGAIQTLECIGIGCHPRGDQTRLWQLYGRPSTHSGGIDCHSEGVQRPKNLWRTQREV